MILMGSLTFKYCIEEFGCKLFVNDGQGRAWGVEIRSGLALRLRYSSRLDMVSVATVASLPADFVFRLEPLSLTHIHTQSLQVGSTST